MPYYKSEITINVTGDEIDLGYCHIHVEAKNSKDAQNKIKKWLSSEINFSTEDIYEIDEPPSLDTAPSKHTLIVGRKSNVDQVLELVEDGLNLKDALNSIHGD